MNLTLSVLPETFAVCRFDPNAQIPSWANKGNFYVIAKTKEELSIVCIENDVPNMETVEKGWRVMKIEGPLDFSLIGIMANLSGILTAGHISIFVISTFDTDYILVKKESLEKAKNIISAVGHTIK